MSIVRCVSALALAVAFGTGFAAPASAFHTCVNLPPYIGDVCVCPVPADPHCRH